MPKKKVLQITPPCRRIYIAILGLELANHVDANSAVVDLGLHHVWPGLLALCPSIMVLSLSRASSVELWR